MTLNEVIQEFENEIVSLIKKQVIENDGSMEPTIFFLITDKDSDGNCEVIRKTIPPTPIDVFHNPSFEGLMKIFFHKFIWDSLLKEITNDKKVVLHFIQTERVNLSDKNVLSIVKKQKGNEGGVDTDLYEIIEQDIVVLENGEMKPSMVELVEMEVD